MKPKSFKKQKKEAKGSQKSPTNLQQRQSKVAYTNKCKQVSDMSASFELSGGMCTASATTFIGQACLLLGL